MGTQLFRIEEFGSSLLQDSDDSLSNRADSGRYRCPRCHSRGLRRRLRSIELLLRERRSVIHLTLRELFLKTFPASSRFGRIEQIFLEDLSRYVALILEFTSRMLLLLRIFSAPPDKLSPSGCAVVGAIERKPRGSFFKRARSSFRQRDLSMRIRNRSFHPRPDEQHVAVVTENPIGIRRCVGVHDPRPPNERTRGTLRACDVTCERGHPLHRAVMAAPKIFDREKHAVVRQTLLHTAYCSIL